MQKTINFWNGIKDRQLTVEYDVIFDQGDFNTPPYEVIDIISIEFEGRDVTHLEWNENMIKDKLFNN